MSDPRDAVTLARLEREKRLMDRLTDEQVANILADAVIPWAAHVQEEDWQIPLARTVQELRIELAENVVVMNALRRQRDEAEVKAEAGHKLVADLRVLCDVAELSFGGFAPAVSLWRLIEEAGL